MNFDEYKNTDPYPKKPKFLTANERELLKRLNHIEDVLKDDALRAEYREKTLAWNKRQNEMTSQFKKDALKDVGLEDHPLADHIYAYAWDEGHALGLREIHAKLENIYYAIFAYEQNRTNAMHTQLAARFRAGRGGSHHRKTIDTIFMKLTQQEARVLSELIGHIEADARNDGANASQKCGPFRRG